jgi:hypothetical protein
MKEGRKHNQKTENELFPLVSVSDMNEGRKKTSNECILVSLNIYYDTGMPE